LVIALIGMWLVGMNSAAEGWGVIQVIRDPLLAAPSAVDKADLEAMVRAAFVTALADNARVNLPLAIGELIVGGLLVVVAAKALFGRRASPSFALQVIVVNAAVLVVGYALRQPVRGRVVEAVVASGVEERPKGSSPEAFAASLRTKTWWMLRFGLGLQLVVLGLSALAVTRRSARELLSPAEREAEEEG
jgi:hypothetical protein